MTQQTTYLIVLPNFNGGGAERVALLIANELALRGKDVHLAVFSDIGPLRALASDLLHVHNLRKDRLRSAAPALVKLICDLRPRVVFSTLGYVNLVLLALKWFLPADVRLWIREANLPSLSLRQNKHHLLMRLSYSLLYPRADLLICSSNRMRDEFVEKFGIGPACIAVLPNPVSERSIRESASLTKCVPDGGTRFIAAGRLTAQKGFDRLLRYFAEMPDTDSRLVILGDGPLGEKLARLATELCVGDRVSFKGFVRNPWAYFANADAFVLPSRWEGMPNAALEALACGVPVIATPESGGISEVAEQAQSGAVTVVEAGPDFIAAMQRVTARRETGLRPSLLPPAYRVDSVIDRFEGWLDLEV